MSQQDTESQMEQKTSDENVNEDVAREGSVVEIQETIQETSPGEVVMNQEQDISHAEPQQSSSSPVQQEKEDPIPEAPVAPPGDGLMTRSESAESDTEKKSNTALEKEDPIPEAPVAPPGDGLMTRSESAESDTEKKSNTALEKEDPIPEAPVAPPGDGLMTRSESAESDTEKKSNTALSLSWSFGMNKNIPVINLTDEHRRMIAYSCAHTGILYDFANNKEYLLQGHANAISSTCVSADRRWFATADKGDNGLVIIWDTYTGNPVRTMFDPHPDGGVVAIAMTPDAKYIATLSAAQKQTVAIWDWTDESDSPLCTAELCPSYGEQTFILFNSEDTSQLVTNSDHQVIFYQWGKGKIDYFAPSLTDEDFNKQVGRYSQSIFMTGSNKALTATSLGNLVVWESCKASKGTMVVSAHETVSNNKKTTGLISAKFSPGGMEVHLTEKGGKQLLSDKKAIKLVKQQEKGINVLTTTDDYIVLGDTLGHVKYLDQKLKLMNWYQDLGLGPISSLSSAYFPDFNNPFEPVEGDYPPDATIKATKFALRDFVIGTTNAVYAHIRTDGTDVKVIQRDNDAAVFALAAHPSKPFVLVASYSGLVKVWDYEQKVVVVSRHFERGHMVRCCAFDQRGEFLALGFTNGIVRICDAVTLEDMLQQPFRFSRDAVTHVTFSHNTAYMAVADAEHITSLFQRQSIEEGDPFCYIGRYRGHYKMIVDLMFGVQLDSNQPRLLSLGEDRHLVEYDLENSSKDDLRVLTSERIEQSAVPLCMAWYPPVTKESFIVTANDQYKFKLYNATTKMCRHTFLSPTFGSAIQKVIVLPTEDPLKDTHHVVYITSDKIGLQKLPLDGNPHNSMALIAHPQGVANVVCSHDGKHIFTAGGIDCTVHMWDINLGALQAQSQLGGEGLVPFYGLLDGGRDGELYKELEDYFYYAQMRSQGVDTMTIRSVSTKIPLVEVPFIMRALGFYPSEQEIDDMLNEVKYSTYVECGQYKTEIDLGEFIKLYVNHRPAFGLESERLMWAFEQLGVSEATVERGELLDVLQNRGEHMTEYELAEYLTTLLGLNDEGGSLELHEFNSSKAGEMLDQNLPHKVTAEMFANELLGFGMYSDVLKIEDNV